MITINDAGLRTTRNKPHNKSPIVHLSFHFNLIRIAETIITLSMQYIITQVIAYSLHSILIVVIYSLYCLEMFNASSFEE